MASSFSAGQSLKLGRGAASDGDVLRSLGPYAHHRRRGGAPLPARTYAACMCVRRGVAHAARSSINLCCACAVVCVVLAVFCAQCRRY